jgi:hypothetical protein
LSRLSPGRPIPRLILTTTDAPRRRKTPRRVFRGIDQGSPWGEKKIGGRPVCARVCRNARGSSARDPTRGRGVGLGDKHSFAKRGALSDCSGPKSSRLLRRRGSSSGGRPSHFSWDARHCRQPLSRDHASDGRRAVPRPGARRRAGALRCDSSIEATLFAAEGFPRSLRCPSAASAFEIARKLSPRCPLGWARSCALLTTSRRASAWLLRPSTLTPVARLRRRLATRNLRASSCCFRAAARAVARRANRCVSSAISIMLRASWRAGPDRPAPPRVRELGVLSWSL